MAYTYLSAWEDFSTGNGDIVNTGFIVGSGGGSGGRYRPIAALREADAQSDGILTGQPCRSCSTHIITPIIF